MGGNQQFNRRKIRSDKRKKKKKGENRNIFIQRTMKRYTNSIIESENWKIVIEGTRCEKCHRNKIKFIS